MFAKGTEIRVTHGKNAGRIGVVMGHSERDGYRVKNSSNGKTMYVKEWYAELAPTTVVKPTKAANDDVWFDDKGFKVGDIVEILDASAALIHSKSANKHENICNRKQCLITLIYEKDNQLVANVVYQGQYAVMPLDWIRFIEKSSDRINNGALGMKI